MKPQKKLLIVLLAAIAVLAVVVGVAVFLASRPERQFDPDYDARVTSPAYPAGGPTLLFDAAHLNAHAPDQGYKPFLDLARSDGYDVRLLREPVTAGRLAGIAVFVVVCPRGTNDAGDEPAFTAAEVDAIDAWVRAGGSLLLITDHWPYGPAAAGLAQRFGVLMPGGFTQDPEHHEPLLGDSNLVFTSENGLLTDHPITQGRGDAERIDRVLTFTGQSLAGPEGAAGFLVLSPSATDRPPGVPVVTKDGGDVRVNMEYGEPAPAAGRSQGLALEVGEGRVVVMGESGMFRAHHDRDGNAVGMNYAGYDNRQLALNILHWLTRLM